MAYGKIGQFNNTPPIAPEQQTSSIHSNGSNASIPIGQSYTTENICSFLGINEEILRRILEQYKDFASLTTEEQTRIVENFVNSESVAPATEPEPIESADPSNEAQASTETTEAPEATETTATTATTGTTGTAETTESPETILSAFDRLGKAEQDATQKYTKENAINFDHRAFAEEKDTQKQLDQYIKELSKNKYLYSNGVEAWNNLSEEDKIALSQQELDAFKQKHPGMFSSDGKIDNVNDFFCNAMLRLQTANNLGISYDEYSETYSKKALNKKLQTGKITQEEYNEQLLEGQEAEHDYLYNYYDGDEKAIATNKKLSADLIRRISDNIIDSKAVIDFVKKSPNYDGRYDNAEFTISPKEIHDTATEFKIDIEAIRDQYLAEQVDKITHKASLLSQIEEAKSVNRDLSKDLTENVTSLSANEAYIITKFQTERQTKIAKKVFGSKDIAAKEMEKRKNNPALIVKETLLDKFRESEDYKKFNKEGADQKSRNRVLTVYLGKELQKCKTDKEKLELIEKFYNELLNGNLFESAEEVADFMNHFFTQADKKTQNVYIQSQIMGIQAVGAENVDKLDKDQRKALQDTQKRIAEVNAEAARILRKLTMDSAVSDETMRDIDYSGCGDTETEAAYFDRGCKIKDPDLQQTITDRTWANSSEAAQQHATGNIGKLNPKNQAHALQHATDPKISKHAKNNTRYFVEQNIYSTLAKEVQSQAQEIIQSAIDTHFDGEEALKLNKEFTNQVVESRSSGGQSTRHNEASKSSTTTQQTNTIYYTAPETKEVVKNVAAPVVQNVEESISKLNLQSDADRQKLIEIVSKDSSIIGKLNPRDKRMVLEIFCKNLNGAQIFDLFKKHPSLGPDLLKFAGGKLNIYKDEMFKILISKSENNMKKYAKELDITLTNFADHNRDYAARIAIKTKNDKLANAIINDPTSYDLLLGSSEHFDLLRITSQKDVGNEPPVHSHNEVIPPKRRDLGLG